MSMLKRFQDKSILIDSLLSQAIVQGNVEIASMLAEQGSLTEYEAGQTLILEGDTDREMYFLLSGRVGVSIKGKYLYPRAPLRAVGEMSAINHNLKRSATIFAEEPTIALKIAPATVERIGNAHPKFYRLIAAEIAARLDQRGTLIRPQNARPRVFFISSSESLLVAKALRHGLRYTEADSVLWSDDQIFRPGTYPLDSLEREMETADFGVAIAHPDDIVRSRDRQQAAPRDNVIFELGFFMSRLGRERTFLLVPRMKEEMKLPSDFKGMTPIQYTPLSGERSEVPSAVLSSTIYELEQAVERLGCLTV